MKNFRTTGRSIAVGLVSLVLLFNGCNKKDVQKPTEQEQTSQSCSQEIIGRGGGQQIGGNMYGSQKIIGRGGYASMENIFITTQGCPSVPQGKIGVLIKEKQR